MRYYTADLHLGHKLVSELRGFPDTDSHDDAVLAGLRGLNPKGDQLWVLGDLSAGSKRVTERALDLLAEIPVPMHLVPGNHCPVHPMHRDAYKWQPRYLEVFESIQPFTRHRFSPGGVRHDALLSHFPYMHAPDGDHTDYERYPQYRLPDMGEWLIHGHTHAPQWRSGHPKSICVSLDAWELRPVGENALADIIAGEVQ